MRIAYWFLLFASVTQAAVANDLFPPEFDHFEPAGNNPVFTAQGPGHWDAKIRERGWILRDGDVWHLWYTGYDDTRGGTRMLGYATSIDGLKWDRVTIDGPLYREHWIEDMCVLKKDDTFYMFSEGFLDRAQWLTSKDAVSWTRQGVLDVRRADGTPISYGAYGTPTVWLEDNVWHLFYERGDLGIWYAKSTDLTMWTNVQDEPVMVPGPEIYDQDLLALNQLFKLNDRYYAVLHGTKKSGDPKIPNQWSTYLATSTDLVHWTKYEHNPLRPIRENKSSGMIFPDGDRFRLYTTHSQVDVYWSH